MSYCRWGEDCDVYMFLSVDRVIECVACTLNEGIPMIFTKRSDAVAHLKSHINNADRVPDDAFKMLRREIEEHGDIVNIKGEI